MSEFEEASAKYQKARDAYWRAESALAVAANDLSVAERERSEAFNREVGAARLRSAVGTTKEEKANGNI